MCVRVVAVYLLSVDALSLCPSSRSLLTLYPARPFCVVLCCVVLASVHAFRCRNGEGLYGLDRMPCRFYETTSLFANLLYSSP